MIRVALIDDHASFRGALAFMLDHEEDLTVVAQAGSVAEAKAALSGVPIDVALIDLDLPDGHGLDLLPILHGHTPQVAVVILSGSIHPNSPALAVDAGAVGFLHKAVGTPEIAAAIRHVAEGETLFSAADSVMLMRHAAHYHARNQSAQRSLKQLTRREMDVLRALAAGLDNNAIAERLYLTTATVRTHVGEILRKLGVESRLQAALLAVRHGEGEGDPDDSV
jgi:DNA-binding NarL/FixJ family response regulator